MKHRLQNWGKFNRRDAEARRKNPKGISSISPALTDEIRLRRVGNHELKSTLKELNQIAAADATPLGLKIILDDDPG
jgi:hypothetical protein